MVAPGIVPGQHPAAQNGQGRHNALLQERATKPRRRRHTKSISSGANPSFLPVEELFKGRHSDWEIVVLGLRWRLSFKLSLRDLAAIMSDRGMAPCSLGAVLAALADESCYCMGRAKRARAPAHDSLAAHSYPAALGRSGNISVEPRDNLGECSSNPQNQS